MLTLGYDGDGNLASQILTSASTGTTTASASYTWDGNGNLTSQSVSTGGTTQADRYAYDADNRLVQDASTTAGTGTDYGWDGAGNRTSVTTWTGTPSSHTDTDTVTAAYDQRDELTSLTDQAEPGGSVGFSWLPNGDQALSTGGAYGGKPIPGTSTEWDAFGDLLYDSTGDSASGTTSTSYSYDALGRLAGSTSSYQDPNDAPPTTSSTAFTYGGLSDGPSSDGTTSVTRDLDGTATSVTSSGSAAVSLLQDAHGDITATYKPATAAITGTTTYNPFGQVTSTSGQAIGLGYQGSWTDPGSGYVMAGARLYDQATGTFLTSDPSSPPIINSASANPYLYADANPTSNNDPSGLSFVSDVDQVSDEFLNDVESAFEPVYAEGSAEAEQILGEIEPVATKIADTAAEVAEEIGPEVAELAPELEDAGACIVEPEVCAVIGLVAGTIALADAAGLAAGADGTTYSAIQVTSPGGQPSVTPTTQKTYVPVTTTWTVDGAEWSEAGGESWTDSTITYYTDHYRYVTTYEQTNYGNGDIGPVKEISRQVERLPQTSVTVPIDNFADVVGSSKMSPAEVYALDHQTPGTPAEAGTGAGCGGGGPPSTCAQSGPGTLPPDTAPTPHRHPP